MLGTLLTLGTLYSLGMLLTLGTLRSVAISGDTRAPEPPDGHEKYPVSTRAYEGGELFALRQSGVPTREKVA